MKFTRVVFVKFFFQADTLRLKFSENWVSHHKVTLIDILGFLQAHVKPSLPFSLGKKIKTFSSWQHVTCNHILQSYWYSWSEPSDSRWESCSLHMHQLLQLNLNNCEWLESINSDATKYSELKLLALRSHVEQWLIITLHSVSNNKFHAS